MAEASQVLERESPPESYEGYRVVIEPSKNRVRAKIGSETLADSKDVLIMRETRLPVAYYFPRDDVRTELLECSDYRTNCPFKGNASYWSLKVDGKVFENAAWSYEDPFEEAALLKGYIAFDGRAIDTWLLDEKPLDQLPQEIGSAEANPLVDWLVQDAWRAESSRELVKRLALALRNVGFPLFRLRLLVRTLNPQLFALTYTWKLGEEDIIRFETEHSILQDPRMLNSPFAPILNGEGGIRRRLEGATAKLDFPILRDLKEEGATDYVAMPLRFSDGQINVLTLVSDQPGGFDTNQLGQLHEILPNLSRLFEAHAQRVSSLTLLRTYLGRNAGKRVMDGLVKRGDGEQLHAAIWMSDLRGSTALADSLPREDFLAALNEYFDAVAGAVIDHDGEILKFIGDAVLAIFAIDDPNEPCPDACAKALMAEAEARNRLTEINIERKARGAPTLEFGVGLHRGDLTYGNIGTQKRLDFTVIGPAVNEVSRIESLCKPLGKPILISSAFAQSYPGNLVSLGHHSLRGVQQAQELFTV